MKQAKQVYLDGRGMGGTAPWKLPRKFKKAERKRIERIVKDRHPCGYSLSYRPRVGWFVEFRSESKRR